jgi:hypothetical protein
MEGVGLVVDVAEHPLSMVVGAPMTMPVLVVGITRLWRSLLVGF